MELNRKNILDKTQYGIKIFAYVLRQFYPDATVLSLSGRTCGITRNPFNEDKETLSIRIENNCAIYSDTEQKSFEGDAFNFAKLYFQSKTEEELLNKINDALHLNLKGEAIKETDWLDTPDDTWYTDCSFFKAPVRNVFPSQTLRLDKIFKLITGNTYKAITQELREIKDIKEKRKFKANRFDYVTFSGVFERRNDKYLLKHSNLITIDFDHLNNIDKVRQQLLSDAYFDTEMLFVSPSGDGLKWIVRINLDEATHSEYFLAITNYIKQTYNIDVDASGKDISRACFLPYDPNAFLKKRHQAL
ncbi:VirE protein [Xanthomarina sp. F1114]|uniref:BT4734/BF3469 family protein n=1 Tax=Xanthomarina sp. F1114 TaxID=2996019 RepID=UPI00225DF973|nr:BT4734/BF3469 family protein [Xanthomarina sp. F1114]MCX7547766.1 VirE protein [Xanthomarina sp. F1114]